MRKGALIYLGAAGFAVASVVLVILQPEGWFLQVVSYGVYALAAGFLGLAVELTVRFFRENPPKRLLEQVAYRTKFTARLHDDYAFGTMVFGYGSLALNSFFAMSKAIVGWRLSSVWLIALSVYYLALCLTKSLVLHRGRRYVPGETEGERLRREWKIYRMCGVLLLGITFTLMGVIVLIINAGNRFTYRGALIFAVAAYDFYCLIHSIVYMVRMRKKHSPVIVSVKSINFATSLTAMLTLQTAMFASFSDGLDLDMQKIMNIMTGTVVCAILVLWGALMVRRSGKELRRLES